MKTQLTLTEIEAQDRAQRVRAHRYEQLLTLRDDAARQLARLSTEAEDTVEKTLRKIIDLANELPDAVHADSVGDAMVSIPGGSVKLRVVPMAASALNRVLRKKQDIEQQRDELTAKLAAAKQALREEFNE
jgi:hypothetical protein